jgi:hypothetical protein
VIAVLAAGAVAVAWTLVGASRASARAAAAEGTTRMDAP